MIKLKELLEQTCDNKLPGETNAQWRARCGPRPLGKIPMGEQEEKKIHSLVSNWEHEKAQVYASVLIEKYGEPDVKGGKMLLWKDVDLIDEENYQYKIKKIDKLYVLDEHIEHSYPADHIDYVYSTLKIPQIQAKNGVSTIDPELVGKFAGVTGSIIIDGLKGEVTARCGDTVANDVTLNFVIDCINGKAEPSKDEYGNRILSIKKKVKEDLRKWFKQKWVNIGKKDKSGKHPPCGTSGKKRGYAKCVPAAKARSMSKKQKASATRRKRAAQNKAGRGGTSSISGGGRKPIRVSTKPKK
tara:strand:- start:556 stop:1452 length:897 start_codon:yes stop_codon:yes gene_type:complete